MKKFTAILLVAVMMVAIFAGCQAKPANAGAAITANIGPEPATIDPTLNDAVDGGTYINHLFEGLTTVDKNLQTQPGMAKEWKISADGTVYTFTLRNAKWSDGKPVTANDFVYSWRRAVDPETAAAYAYQMFYIKNAEAINGGKMAVTDLGVKAIDEKTLEVTLESATGYFLSLTSFPTYFPLREDVVSADPEKWASEASTIVTNGPYTLKAWEHDSEIVMEKSATYWNAANILAQTLTFKLMSDETSILAAFKTEDILFADTLPNAEIEAAKADGTLTIKPQLGTYFYVVNTTKKPYDDARVRKALALAIDRNFIIEKVSKGNQLPAYAFVPTGVPDAAKGSDFRATGKTYYSVKPEDFAANVTEAKKLLADAGYPDGKGFPTVNFISNSGKGHSDIAQAIQQMWKTNLGIDMTISQQEWAVFQQTRRDGNYEVARHGWLGDYVDPMTFLDMWTTTAGTNDAKYSNTAYDALIKTAKTSADQAVRMKALHDAEDILIGDDMAIIPIYYYTDLFLTNKTLHDVVYSPLGFKYFMWSYIQ